MPRISSGSWPTWAYLSFSEADGTDFRRRLHKLMPRTSFTPSTQRTPIRRSGPGNYWRGRGLRARYHRSVRGLHPDDELFGNHGYGVLVGAASPGTVASIEIGARLPRRGIRGREGRTSLSKACLGLPTPVGDSPGVHPRLYGQVDFSHSFWDFYPLWDLYSAGITGKPKAPCIPTAGFSRTHRKLRDCTMSFRVLMMSPTLLAGD